MIQPKTKWKNTEKYVAWTFDHEVDLRMICAKAAELAINEFLTDGHFNLSEYELDGSTRNGVLYLEFDAWDGRAAAHMPLEEFLADEIRAMAEPNELAPLLRALRNATEAAERRMQELETEELL